MKCQVSVLLFFWHFSCYLSFSLYITCVLLCLFVIPPSLHHHQSFQNFSAFPRRLKAAVCDGKQEKNSIRNSDIHKNICLHISECYWSESGKQMKREIYNTKLGKTLMKTKDAIYIWKHPKFYDSFIRWKF